METLLRIGLSNAMVAAALGIVVVGISRCCRRPALVHSLWLLVLLKLVTPPLWTVPIGGLFPAPHPAQPDSSAPPAPMNVASSNDAPGAKLTPIWTSPDPDSSPPRPTFDPKPIAPYDSIASLVGASREPS